MRAALFANSHYDLLRQIGIITPVTLPMIKSYSPGKPTGIKKRPIAIQFLGTYFIVMDGPRDVAYIN